ncbi:NAD(P)/FAD-dependent oxidoreductase [Sphingomonas sp. RIT328]|uniref:NAD(P)/FAD-dependent oxidoreductase n=1 Tax=Sphingomonas sp. RIT328 TaxID=1470591 RepID=UPI000450EF51|nr:FAD-dependent monooxygenase [Sphingomonas sp. RIT328]EZP49227.1 Monooxygenase, FAD-binding precursor [Sphingomonas sp. RIT328]
MRRTPALIVGGGPAGSAAAIRLARGGTAAVLVERQDDADALCGGFLSWRSLDRLAALGVDADRLNRARLTEVTLFAGDLIREARLPRPALGVSRRRLDRVLRDAADRAGAVIETSHVRAIDGTTAQIGEMAITADALFLATGKHDVRGLARPATARGSDPTLGLRLRLPASPALSRTLAGRIELHLFDRGYAGIALQEDGSANVCMAVHRSRLHAAGSPAELLALLAQQSPRLGDRLAGRDPAGPIDAIANVPYGWRQRHGSAGLFRLGDQAGVIPSLAGEGMGIALASGVSAADAYLRGGPAAAAAWQRDFARSLARPMAVAGMVRRLAESPCAAGVLRWLPPALIQVVAHATRMAP